MVVQVAAISPTTVTKVNSILGMFEFLNEFRRRVSYQLSQYVCRCIKVNLRDIG